MADFLISDFYLFNYQNRELKKISILNKSDIIHQKTRHLNHSTLAAWNRM